MLNSTCSLAFGDAMQRRPHSDRKLAKKRGRKAETPKRRADPEQQLKARKREIAHARERLANALTALGRERPRCLPMVSPAE